MALDCCKSWWAGASSLTLLLLPKILGFVGYGFSHIHGIPGRERGISNIEEMWSECRFWVVTKSFLH